MYPRTLRDRAFIRSSAPRGLTRGRELPRDSGGSDGSARSGRRACRHFSEMDPHFNDAMRVSWTFRPTHWKPNMPSLAILGATGNLGRHVAAQALAAGWELAVAVRTRGRLPPDVAAQAQVVDLELSTATTEQLANFAAGYDAFVFCAGVVTEGEAFVRMVDKVVSALESLQPGKRPVCWFLAGAALLPLDTRGRLGVDLPKVRGTYWPHRRNYERLQRSSLDWRLLCPGPMVDQPPLGLRRLRVSRECLPAPLPGVSRFLPLPLVLPLFAMKVPEMIIPYADGAAVILANMGPGGAVSRCRVGVALPPGMKGKKPQWAAQPRDTTS